MTNEQLDRLVSLTSNLVLIKKIADEDQYTINTIIDFMNNHSGYSDSEFMYFINILTNCENDEKRYAIVNILNKNNYNYDELKTVIDFISNIKDVKKYDFRIDFFKSTSLAYYLTSEELLIIANSKDEKISEKVKLIGELVSQYNNDSKPFDEEFHNRVSEIINYVSTSTKKGPVKRLAHEFYDSKRNDHIKDSIRKKLLAADGAKFERLINIKMELDKINLFDNLWSIEYIISLFESNGKKLSLDQMELLIKINASCSNFISSRINSYFENLELIKYRDFDEILNIARNIVPYKYFGDFLDVETLLTGPGILSNRTYEQSMFFVNQLNEFEKEEHSFDGLNALYELALLYDVPFDTLKKQFEFTKSLDNDFDKVCAVQIFKNAKYTGKPNFEDAVKYINEIVECDSPQKKQALASSVRFIEQNDNLTDEEKWLLVKMIKKAFTKTEAKAISEIVSFTTSAPLSDQLALIDLDESSYYTSIVKAQNDIKKIRKISSASSIDEIKDILSTENKVEKSGFHI